MYDNRFLLGVGTKKRGFSPPTFYFGKNRVVNKSKLTNKIREIAENATNKLALELVHVEIVGSGKKQTIRIYIDKEQGIIHDDCSAVSEEVEKVLDEEDLIPNSYVLEVSSPGIERGLYSIKDFERFVDSKAKVKTHTSINGQKNFLGKIIEVIDEDITFDDKTNGIVDDSV